MVLSTPAYVDDGDVGLRELPVKDEWEGKLVRELDVPAKILIVLIKRSDGTTVVPRGDTVVDKGDILVVNETD